jgi:hypothetical protein
MKARNANQNNTEIQNSLKVSTHLTHPIDQTLTITIAMKLQQNTVPMGLAHATKTTKLQIQQRFFRFCFQALRIGEGITLRGDSIPIPNCQHLKISSYF